MKDKIKIGETFYFNDIKLQVTISKSSVHCYGCFFSMPYCHKPTGIGDCVADNREGPNIIFKKIN